jgi:hypothetical protein
VKRVEKEREKKCGGSEKRKEKNATYYFILTKKIFVI